MPAKSVVDCMIYELFKSDSIALCMIHRGTFKKEYEQFWANPQSSPIIWIGLLFAIMCLSINIGLLTGDNSPSYFTTTALRDPHEALASFREKVVQCLVLGKYVFLQTKYSLLNSTNTKTSVVIRSQKLIL